MRFSTGKQISISPCFLAEQIEFVSDIFLERRFRRPEF